MINSQQREIKFRAWDIREKRFIVEGFYIIGETTVFNMLEQFQYERKEKYPDVSMLEALNDLHIEQYTGLKDSAGREIYEGDIMMATNPLGKRVKKAVENINDIWETIGIINKKLHKNCLSTMHTIHYMNMKVIGNIHENPELLECSDKPEPEVE